MSKYQIFRWDGILAANGLNKQPMIYIMPDIAFLQFSEANNGKLVVEIEGTNSIYDGKQISGVVNKSSFMPNFSEETNLYVVVLECDWYGYPDVSSLGTVTFFGLRNEEYYGY